jgi:type VI secretion system protein ImpH
MAATSGGTDAPLTTVLREEPYRFDFFQAVRLLERIHRERKPVGRAGTEPERETVRFRTRVSLQFPPSQIYSIAERNGARPEENRDEDPQQQMTVAFMGLTGPLGVLPQYYTELLMERVRYKDTALWDFLDLFNHRLISLFYRAWEKHRFPVAYERGSEDRFTEYLFDLIGMGTEGLRREHLGFPDEGLILYGGLIAQRPHSSTALKSALSDFFGVRARINQFSGQWLKLDVEDLTRVGRANNQLGYNTVAGTRVWNDQSKFRVELGPMTLREFIAFLPIGAANKPMTEMTRFFVGIEFDFDVQLVLKKEEVPPLQLSTSGASFPMLGWTTWLKTKSFTEDDRQVVLSAKN